MLILYLIFFFCSIFMLVITIMGETSIQLFSKPKLFILYKNHRNFIYIKHFKENITEMVFTSLIANYIFHSIASTLFIYIFLYYFNLPLIYGSIFLFFFITSIEIIIKKISISYPEQSLLEVGYLYIILFKIFGKVASIINNIIVYIMQRLFSFHENVETEDSELLSIVELKMEDDYMSGQMIKNILQIKNIYVEDVMTSKNNIISVTFNKNFQIMEEEIFNMSENNIKAYLPIWHHKKNIFIGVLNTTKFFIAAKKKNTHLKKIMEKIFFVPSGTNIYKMLQIFQQHIIKFAFVVNEYGEVVGIITVQDILLEIVNYEENINLIKNEQVLILDGEMSIKELQKYFHNNFFVTDVHTYSINDVIIKHTKCIPEEGTKIAYQNIFFTVLDCEDNKIVKVLVSLK
jgi:CBS domain containing-hemolysin-like protein